MDKYEYKLRLDELKTLVGKQKYEQAAELCDELNWKKVKNVNSLVQAGEAYEKVGRFEDARGTSIEGFEDFDDIHLEMDDMDVEPGDTVVYAACYALRNNVSPVTIVLQKDWSEYTAGMTAQLP